MNMMLSSSNHFLENGIASFFFRAEKTLLCIRIPHSVYPLIEGHLGCFDVLATVNDATRNTDVLISLWYPNLDSVVHAGRVVWAGVVVF